MIELRALSILVLAIAAAIMMVRIGGAKLALS